MCWQIFQLELCTLGRETGQEELNSSEFLPSWGKTTIAVVLTVDARVFEKVVHQDQLYQHEISMYVCA